ncbi:hypothetical protein BDV33DRAFT_186199 [Aspergillus novoparasiticus]|uniref:Uncharacterized protein n=1 Tax=Aspergillus novoparasiticus TaxID=986946 RepID=A0A5N6E634_9EURO|nr:hypothetical protein BDV33DRAFT_186199 [Aspergillus novoparasiticus]
MLQKRCLGLFVIANSITEFWQSWGDPGIFFGGWGAPVLSKLCIFALRLVFSVTGYL